MRYWNFILIQQERTTRNIFSTRYIRIEILAVSLHKLMFSLFFFSLFFSFYSWILNTKVFIFQKSRATSCMCPRTICDPRYFRTLIISVCLSFFVLVKIYFFFFFFFFATKSLKVCSGRFVLRFDLYWIYLMKWEWNKFFNVMLINMHLSQLILIF